MAEELKAVPQRKATAEGNFYPPTNHVIGPGMNERVQRLRKLSVETEPSLSIERALQETAFYKEHYGKVSIPMLRALNFLDHCRKKTLYLGKDELIVGERGPSPKAVPTFPELTCHSVEDLRVLRTREQQRYTISDEDIEIYAREVIPYWQGRTVRERIFSHVPQAWQSAYEAGLFTEFMEQRAPGHTALDGKIYRRGLRDFKRQIAEQLETLDYLNYKTVEYRLDAYWTVDVKLEQRLFDHWVISLSGINVLNNAYGTYLATFFNNTTFNTAVATYPGKERSFYLKLSYEH